MPADEPSLVTSDWVEATFSEELADIRSRLSPYDGFDNVCVRPPGRVRSDEEDCARLLVPVVARADGYYDEMLLSRVYLDIDIAVAEGVVEKPDVDMVFKTGWKVFGRITHAEFQLQEDSIDEMEQAFQQQSRTSDT